MQYDFPEQLAQELHELLLSGAHFPLNSGSNDQDSRALRQSVRAMLRVFVKRDAVRMRLCVRRD